MNKINFQHLRIARSTNQLDAIMNFYCEGLGFEVIAGFEDHDGFDGIMLALPGESYHLEFTHERGTKNLPKPSRENLLVFYIPEKNNWQKLVNHLIAIGNKPVKSYNPYWDKQGITFKDPDGNRIVLQNASWRT